MSNRAFAAGGKTLALPVFQPRFPWIGGDLQTLRNVLRLRDSHAPLARSQRLHLATTDGSGDVLQAALDTPDAPGDKPTVLLIHGLTGCETSHNICVSARFHLDRGHPVIRLNLRGAGPSLGKTKHAYNAGRSADLRDALAALPAAIKTRGLFLVGVSLGGNMLLKALAEGDGLDDVIGAATVCAPIDLAAAQRRIMEPRNFLYHGHFLHSLNRDAQRASPHDPDLARTLKQIRTLYDFDDLITGPRAGFTGAQEYYRKSSAGPLLPAIRIPTLALASMSDPVVPVAMYLDRHWPKDGPLHLAIAPDGGHVGFHAMDSAIPWHDRVIGAFIDTLF